MAKAPTVTSSHARPWPWIGAGAIVLPLLLLLAAGLRHDPRALPSPLLGRTAPPFTLQLFDGRLLRSADVRGRIVVLNFWASWCVPACTDEAPELQAIWNHYRERGVMVVGVNIQDQEKLARAFIRRFGQTFPIGMDPQGTLSIDYGVYGVPETFILNRRGTIARKYAGAVSEDLLAPIILSLAEAR